MGKEKAGLNPLGLKNNFFEIFKNQLYNLIFAAPISSLEISAFKAEMRNLGDQIISLKRDERSLEPINLK